MMVRGLLLLLLLGSAGACSDHAESAPAVGENRGAVPVAMRPLPAPAPSRDLAYKTTPPADPPGSALSPGEPGRDGWEAREEYVDEITGMVLVHVPGGAFHMGCDEFAFARREQPVHLVSLSDFWMARHEVTRHQWALVMGEDSAPPEDRERPVTGASWYEAEAFAQELAAVSGLAYRLPTEAEWEYAAREGGRECVWSGTSEIWELASYAWYGANSGGRSHAVGSRRPNALGLYDLSGNVWEWCHDWYDAEYYRRSETNDPQGPPLGLKRVLRGGSWDNSAIDCRATFRLAYRPDVSSAYIGFRVVLSSP